MSERTRSIIEIGDPVAGLPAVGPLTVAYERECRERGRDAAYHSLARRLRDLHARGELGGFEPHEVSFRVRYADLLARFDAELVDRYRARLRFAVRPEVHRGVLPGHYALPVKVPAPDGNEVVFYEVEGFHEEALADYRVVKRLVGPATNMVPRKQVASVFRRIREYGPDAATFRYRRFIGVCKACGARLTNTGSRADAMGPWCGRHRGEAAEAGLTEGGGR